MIRKKSSREETVIQSMPRRLASLWCMPMIVCIGFMIGLMAPGTSMARNYYFDASASTDGDGTLASPWKSIAALNNHAPFLPGDSILLKRGSSFTGQLAPKGSGDSTAQIVLGAYGSGAKPIVDAQGVTGTAAVYLNNQEYWTVENLQVTNWATTYAFRWGIRVTTTESRVFHRIHILNNTVRKVYATPMRSGTPWFYDVAGIRVNAKSPSRMNDVLIEGNELFDIVGQGICFWGEMRNWTNLSTQVRLRRNTIKRTGADGILITGTDNELVEYNVVDSAGQLGVIGTDYIAGIWPAWHRDGLWQFNVVSHTKLWSGDGQAFDNDHDLKGTTIYQFNYTYENEGGFFLDCSGPGPDGGKTIVRYNISVNDTGNHRCADCWDIGLDRGNAEFYNNIIYAPGGNFYISPHYPQYNGGDWFRNNIFCVRTLTWGNNMNRNYNVYFGGASSAGDANALTADPLFVNPGGFDKDLASLAGFKFQANSPCIGSGTLISENGGRDFWGSVVSATTPPNRGADNSTGSTMAHPRSSRIESVIVRPARPAGINLYTMRGEQVNICRDEAASACRSGVFVFVSREKYVRAQKAAFFY